MTQQLLAENYLLKDKLKRYDKLWDELPNKVYHILLEHGQSKPNPEEIKYTPLDIRNILARRF